MPNHPEKMKSAESSKKQNMTDMINCFNLPQKINCQLDQVSNDGAQGWSGMTNIIQICTDQLISIICPRPLGTNLQHSLAQKMIMKM